MAVNTVTTHRRGHGCRITTAVAKVGDIIAAKGFKSSTLTIGDLIPVCTHGKVDYYAYTGAGTFAPVMGASSMLGVNPTSHRFGLIWRAGEHGIPGIHGDAVSATEATSHPVDRSFELVGTNVATSLCTRNASGGLACTTAAGGSDQFVIVPQIDLTTTGQYFSPWKTTAMYTTMSPQWECLIKTPSVVSSGVTLFMAGLKLSAGIGANFTTTYDNDAALFYFTSGATSYWGTSTNVNNVDTAANTTTVVAASTVYHLRIEVDSSRVPRYFVDGNLIATGPAMYVTGPPALMPVIGWQSSAARSFVVFGQAMSRIIA